MRALRLAAVLLAVLVLGVSIVKARGESIQLMLSESMVGTSAVGMNEDQEVIYDLPYPGILPGHYLYPVKMVRDRIVEWLTFDTEKKIELLILYADKRMASAKILLEGGEERLGTVTGLKAMMYQDRAIVMIEELKAGGGDVGALANRLERGTAKYHELWKDLVGKVSEQTKPRMDEYKDRAAEHNRRLQRVLERE